MVCLDISKDACFGEVEGSVCYQRWYTRRVFFNYLISMLRSIRCIQKVRDYSALARISQAHSPRLASRLVLHFQELRLFISDLTGLTVFMILRSISYVD